MFKRILVIRAGALGDTVLALPSLQILRQQFPQAHIEVVGYPVNWSVALPRVDRITSIDLPAFGGLYSGTAHSGLAREVAGIDLVVAWTVRDPRLSLQDAGAERTVWCSPLPPPDIHAAQWLVDSLEDLIPGDPQSAPPNLHLSRAELDRGEQTLSDLGLERPIILHPGAGTPWKRWPPDRFAQLGDSLRAGGSTVALACGPADADSVAAVQATGARPFAVLPELPARHLGAVLARSVAVVGNDSGVTHLAAAAGAPTVALFGPTDPVSWSPTGRVQVVRGCTERPTQAGQIRICDDPRCMDGISVAQVLEVLSDLVRVQEHGSQGDHAGAGHPDVESHPLSQTPCAP